MTIIYTSLLTIRLYVIKLYAKMLELYAEYKNINFLIIHESGRIMRLQWQTISKNF